MKRKTTKEILAESFREVAQSRPADKITIREIVENCGYSPATFYRHFRDKYDLIAWDYVHHSEAIMDRVGKGDYRWRDTLTDGMRYFAENRAYMQNLLRNTGGYDAFVRHLSEANIAHLTRCIRKLTGEQEPDPDLAILVRIYCLGTGMVVCQWLAGEIRIEPEHLAERMEQALPDALRQILC